MDKLFPLTLIHANPLLGDIARALRTPEFNNLSIRMRMNIVNAYLNYLCSVKGSNPDPMRYDFGLPPRFHTALLEWLSDYVNDIIYDTTGISPSHPECESIRNRVLTKVTGTQVLPIIIAVDSESKKDRELYDRHM